MTPARSPRMAARTRLVVVGIAVAVAAVVVVVVVNSRDDTSTASSAATASSTVTGCGGPCGTWELEPVANTGEHFPQTMHITEFDAGTGAIGGDMTGGIRMTGVLNGSTATFSNNAPRPAEYSVTLSGTAVGSTMTGTWSDSVYSGTVTATRTS